MVPSSDLFLVALHWILELTVYARDDDGKNIITGSSQFMN